MPEATRHYSVLCVSIDNGPHQRPFDRQIEVYKTVIRTCGERFDRLRDDTGLSGSCIVFTARDENGVLWCFYTSEPTPGYTSADVHRHAEAALRKAGGRTQYGWQ